MINNIIYLTFIYSFTSVAVLNVAFQLNQTALYILLFNVFFGLSFILFLGILYYHAHKYILQYNETYCKYFTSVSNFINNIVHFVKQLIQKHCCSPDGQLPERTPVNTEDCALREELLVCTN